MNALSCLGSHTAKWFEFVIVVKLAAAARAGSPRPQKFSTALASKEKNWTMTDLGNQASKQIILSLLLGVVYFEGFEICYSC